MKAILALFSFLRVSVSMGLIFLCGDDNLHFRSRKLLGLNDFFSATTHVVCVQERESEKALTNIGTFPSKAEYRIFVGCTIFSDLWYFHLFNLTSFDCQKYLANKIEKASNLQAPQSSKTASPMGPQCVPNASQMRHQCVINASPMHPQCVPNASPMRPQCVPNASPMLPQCVLNAFPMSPQCVLNVLPIHPQCISNSWKTKDSHCLDLWERTQQQRRKKWTLEAVAKRALKNR